MKMVQGNQLLTFSTAGTAGENGNVRETKVGAVGFDWAVWLGAVVVVVEEEEEGADGAV